MMLLLLLLIDDDDAAADGDLFIHMSHGAWPPTAPTHMRQTPGPTLPIVCRSLRVFVVVRILLLMR